jgi:hypothetical protein
MQIEFQLLTPPVSEPLSRDEAKAWLKVDHSDEDTLIDLLITTTRERCESLTGLSLLSQQWVAYLAYWPVQADDDWWDGVREGAYSGQAVRELSLRHGPVRQIDAFTLFDADGNGMDYPENQFLLDKVRDRLVLKPGAPIPIGQRAVNPIEITYTAGYEIVPGAIKAGLLRMIAHLYEHRGDENVPVPRDVLGFWQPYTRIKI